MRENLKSNVKDNQSLAYALRRGLTVLALLVFLAITIVLIVVRSVDWIDEMNLLSREEYKIHQTGPWVFFAEGPTGGAPKPLWFATPIMRCCGLVNIVLSILDV